MKEPPAGSEDTAKSGLRRGAAGREVHGEDAGPALRRVALGLGSVDVVHPELMARWERALLGLRDRGTLGELYHLELPQRGRRRAEQPRARGARARARRPRHDVRALRPARLVAGCRDARRSQRPRRSAARRASWPGERGRALGPGGRQNAGLGPVSAPRGWTARAFLTPVGSACMKNTTRRSRARRWTRTPPSRVPDGWTAAQRERYINDAARAEASQRPP